MQYKVRKDFRLNEIGEAGIQSARCGETIDVKVEDDAIKSLVASGHIIALDAPKPKPKKIFGKGSKE